MLQREVSHRARNPTASTGNGSHKESIQSNNRYQMDTPRVIKVGKGTVDGHKHKQEPGSKSILLWTTVYGKNDFGSISEFTACPYNKCHKTTDRSKLRESSAILFHMWDLANHKKKDLPPIRLPHQVWILFGRESAASANFTLYYDVDFNATYTFRRDADIFFGHGCYTKSKTVKKSDTNYAAGKSQLSAWVISNCNATSRRDLYIRELCKYMNVDGFGKCASKQCSDVEHDATEQDCKSRIAKTYKFYLAFENSICNDYVTEKTWLCLFGGIVPVVLGGKGYTDILPPNSFIDVRNFTSPRSLANYLIMLDRNDRLYNLYFKWRENSKLGCERTACALCKYLHTHTKAKVYEDIGSWWGKCENPMDYYRKTAPEISIPK